MPYTTTSSNLPEKVKKMGKKKRKQWVEVFNSALEGGADESSAFAQAYGVVKEKGYIMGLYDIDERQVSQEAAQYDPIGMADGKACANCNWFVPADDACVLVQGDIVSTGLSKFWLAKQEHTMEPMPVTIVKEQDEESLIERVLNRVKSLFGLEPKVAGVVKQNKAFEVIRTKDGQLRFFGWVSNNFKDKHGETIPGIVHKEFVDWVDESGKYPELWLWHTGFRIGQVDWLDVDDGYLVTSGLIDKEYEYIVDNFGDEEIGMSHGSYMILLKDGTVAMYRSYEFSALPNERAAAFGTSFTTLGKELAMPFSDSKKEWLKKVGGFTDEQVAGFEAKTAELASSLKGAGFQWKDDEEVAEGVTNVSIAADLAPILNTQNQLIEAMTALGKSVVDLAGTVAEIKKSDDEKVAAHMQAKIAQAPAAYEASKAGDNVVDKKKSESDVDWFNQVMNSVVKVG